MIIVKLLHCTEHQLDVHCNILITLQWYMYDYISGTVHYLRGTFTDDPPLHLKFSI